MLLRRAVFLAVLSASFLCASCGSDRSLIGIQIYAADPNLAHNTSYYIAPGATIQLLIQGSYSDRTAQTLSSTSGKWSSTSTDIATVDTNGLVTSAGPEGVTTISAVVSGHTSNVTLGVCPVGVVVCPPPPNP